MSQEFQFALRRRVDVGLRVDFRRRDYTTDVVLDGGRFDRQDDYMRFRAELSKGWKNDLELRVQAAAIDNDSERADPTVETDEAGYTETTFGIGLRYEF